VSQDKIDTARNATLAAMRGVLAQQKIQGRITLSGYEGSELLVARLLVECGADLRYVGSACPATPWNAQDAAWLQSKGVHVQFRASLEQDIAAFHEFYISSRPCPSPASHWASSSDNAASASHSPSNCASVYDGGGAGSITSRPASTLSPTL
jgi:hypothetical protein